MGGKQLGFRFAEGFAYGDYQQTTANKLSKRKRFLAEMELVSSKALADLIQQWCGMAMKQTTITESP